MECRNSVIHGTQPPGQSDYHFDYSPIATRWTPYTSSSTPPPRPASGAPTPSLDQLVEMSIDFTKSLSISRSRKPCYYRADIREERFCKKGYWLEMRRPNELDNDRWGRGKSLSLRGLCVERITLNEIRKKKENGSTLQYIEVMNAEIMKVIRT